jgi:hypothetical protein
MTRPTNREKERRSIDSVNDEFEAKRKTVAQLGVEYLVVQSTVKRAPTTTNW